MPFMEGLRLSSSPPRFSDVRKLSILPHVLGDEHRATIACMSDLTKLYTKQERYTDAEPLLMTVSEIGRRKVRHHHPYAVNSINNLVQLY